MEHTAEQRQKLLTELISAHEECVETDSDLDSIEDQNGILISANEAKIIIEIIKTWQL